MTLWTPTWSIDIDGVEYKDVALANLNIGSGRTDIYEQAIAGYCNLTLINTDDSAITAGINSAVTVYINNSSGTPVAIFGGSVTDLIVGVQSGGSIGVTQTISIVALGALSRLPKHSSLDVSRQRFPPASLAATICSTSSLPAARIR